MTWKTLCSVHDIQENEAKGFSLGDDPAQQDIFVVRRDNQFHAYRNSCPHTGVELNWQPDEFMDFEHFYILCSVHGARFNVEDGFCVWGPCLNQSLTPVPLRIERDQIEISP